MHPRPVAGPSQGVDGPLGGYLSGWLIASPYFRFDPVVAGADWTGQLPAPPSHQLPASPLSMNSGT